jgi:DegV family protein with EDD domain
MSSILSSATFAVAENVREMYEKTIPIINIDSRQLATGVGNVLMGVIDIIREHENESDIVRLSREVVKNTFTYMVVPDLNYLARGGRIGKAKALMGSVLRIIPIVGLMGDDEDGLVVPLDRGRTYKQVNDKLIDLVKAKMAEKSVTKIKRLIINELGDNQDAFLDLKEKIKSLPCNDMMNGRPDLTAAVHGGPKAYYFSITV